MIIATSVLGPRFNYSHVRWVIYINTPSQMSDFLKESKRAGRDSTKAYLIVMLSITWKPQLDKQLPPDQEAIQLYLT